LFFVNDDTDSLLRNFKAERPPHENDDDFKPNENIELIEMMF